MAPPMTPSTAAMSLPFEPNSSSRKPHSIPSSPLRFPNAWQVTTPAWLGIGQRREEWQALPFFGEAAWLPAVDVDLSKNTNLEAQLDPQKTDTWGGHRHVRH